MFLDLIILKIFTHSRLEVKHYQEKIYSFIYVFVLRLLYRCPNLEDASPDETKNEKKRLHIHIVLIVLNAGSILVFVLDRIILRNMSFVVLNILFQMVFP